MTASQYSMQSCIHIHGPVLHASIVCEVQKDVSRVTSGMMLRVVEESDSGTSASFSHPLVDSSSRLAMLGGAARCILAIRRLYLSCFILCRTMHCDRQAATVRCRIIQEDPEERSLDLVSR